MDNRIVFLEKTGKRKSKYRCTKCGFEFELLDKALGNDRTFIHSCEMGIEECSRYENIDINGIHISKIIGKSVFNDYKKTELHVEAICQYCGATYPAVLASLKNGVAYQHCGCHKATPKYNDLTGQKFGRLTAIRLADGRGKSGERLWVCTCECSPDIERIYSSIALRAGHVKSCGCYCRDRTREANRKRFENLSGRKFSLLTAEYPTDKRYGGTHDGQGYVVWHCKCDCGGECDVPSNLLKNGVVKSCGCISSYGEAIIEMCLKRMNVSYEKHKGFDTCRNALTGYMLYFDFWLPDKNVLIEYDGEQHYGYMSANTWNDESNFKSVLLRDKIKNDWCQLNCIPLIRIPFSENKNLNEDFLSAIIAKAYNGNRNLFIPPDFSSGIASRNTFLVKTSVSGEANKIS